MVEQHIIVTGNPLDGLEFYGPFDTSDEAGEWAEKKIPNNEWWIATLEDAKE